MQMESISGFVFSPKDDKMAKMFNGNGYRGDDEAATAVPSVAAATGGVLDLSRESSPIHQISPPPRHDHSDDGASGKRLVDSDAPPVPNDPRAWSRSDVGRWLQWSTRFYQLDSIDLSKFAMNGRGLCLMTRQGFLERAPTSGDVLYGDFSRRVAVSVLYNHDNRRMTPPQQRSNTNDKS